MSCRKSWETLNICSAKRVKAYTPSILLRKTQDIYTDFITYIYSYLEAYIEGSIK